MLRNIKSIEVGRYVDVEIGKIELHHFHDNFMLVDVMNIVFKDFSLFFNFQKIYNSILGIRLKNHQIHSVHSIPSSQLSHL